MVEVAADTLAPPGTGTLSVAANSAANAVGGEGDTESAGVRGLGYADALGVSVSGAATAATPEFRAVPGDRRRGGGGGGRGWNSRSFLSGDPEPLCTIGSISGRGGSRMEIGRDAELPLYPGEL